jgi:hypothetical protein
VVLVLVCPGYFISPVPPYLGSVPLSATWGGTGWETSNSTWKIFGPTRENQLRRIKTNDELDKLIKHQNIINHIKALRLSWFGPVQRMPESRTVKKIFNWTPLTTRSKGRPKQRWEDNIIQDICQLNVKNWTACAQDRVKWKNVVEKAKTFNKRS